MPKPVRLTPHQKRRIRSLVQQGDMNTVEVAKAVKAPLVEVVRLLTPPRKFNPYKGLTRRMVCLVHARCALGQSYERIAKRYNIPASLVRSLWRQSQKAHKTSKISIIK